MLDNSFQGVGHCSSVDVTVNGLTIPAGTYVSPLMVEILKGDYWGDGTTFRPERFIDSEGKCRKDDHLIPFSIGGQYSHVHTIPHQLTCFALSDLFLSSLDLHRKETVPWRDPGQV